ncbi:MAG: carboxy terminal-processing peptidase [Bacteroidia bacterium]
MKTFPCLLLYLLSLLPLAAPAQNEPQYCRETRRLLSLFNERHYSPMTLDSAATQRVLLTYIDALDPDRLIFTQQDIDELAPAWYGLSDQVRAGGCACLSVSIDRYRARLGDARQRLDSYVQQAPDYTQADTLRFSMQALARPRAADDAALDRYWQRWFKYKTLLRYYYQQQPSDTPATAFADLEPTLRRQALTREQCRIDQVLGHPMGFEAYAASVFLKNLSEQFDPHSAYFSAYEKDRFESSLATEALSFGIELDENRYGDIEIGRLTPGGPAWRSKELHKGDVLIDIRLPDGQVVELDCQDLDAIEDLLSRHDRLSLTVRKQSGRFQQVALAREQVAVTENIINSLVLEGDRRLGYIHLPGFYTDWEDERALGCANDVAKELFRLRQEGIEGLIIDLRYNGGGAMTEALQLAGIFIDEGPLCVMQQRKEGIRSLKDANRGTIYDGPMIVLVNGLSASASEIFAAAMQDYRRAVIVGTPTYGKASGQVVLPLTASSAATSGFVKVSVSRFYRLDGSTHQRQGVQPDVLLPDALAPFMPAEADDATAFPGDSMAGGGRPFQPLPPLPLDALAARSGQRLDTSARFGAIRMQYEDALRLVQTDLDLQLAAASFPADMQRIEQRFRRSDEAQTAPSPVFTARNHRTAAAILAIDPLLAGQNQSLIDKLTRDPYLEEACFILNDLIVLTGQ